ncbi:MAG: hypothetical protein AVDCRST_MAG87-2952, partial [uncultured Thermomicrobiales bacterium]
WPCGDSVKMRMIGTLGSATMVVTSREAGEIRCDRDQPSGSRSRSSGCVSRTD